MLVQGSTFEDIISFFSTVAIIIAAIVFFVLALLVVRAILDRWELITIEVDPLCDLLRQDGECVCSDKQSATLSYSVHAS